MNNELNFSKDDLMKLRDNLYSMYSEVGKALAHPVRLIILDLLLQSKSLTVEDITLEASIPLVSVSQHLQVLKRSGLVNSDRQGTYVYYTLASDEIYQLLNIIKKTSEKTKNEITQTVDTYFSYRNKMDEISLEELCEKLKTDSILLIDLRKPREYENGHIDKSISIPYKSLHEEFPEILDRHFPEINKDKQVAVYCRGNYCICSDIAVKELQKRGIKALRLNAGYPEWKVLQPKPCAYHSKAKIQK